VEFNPFDKGGIQEEEGFPVVSTIISAHGFTLRAGTNQNIRVALSPKYPSLAARLFVLMLPYILAGGESGDLDEEFSGGPRVEGFVINVGRRVRCSFCSGHLKEKAKKIKKNEGTRV